MAPKVVVPADFGRHHIGSPSHGNLTINLGKGVEVKANSIILSLNSPVIDDLTSNLHLLSLEADDFSREAVDCFIEAAYTGEIEAVNLENFRDVNKMSRVFQVSWLVAKCKKYFMSHLDKLSGKSSFTELLFAVEESLYLSSALKDREFFNLVVKKMSSINAWKRSYFARQYLQDLSTCNHQQIDICLKIVSPELTYVIVDLLLTHLAKGGNKSLDQKSRYILNDIDISNCFLERPDLGERLFSVLEDFEEYSTADSRLFLSLLKQKCSFTIQNCEMMDMTPLSCPLLHTICKSGDLNDVLQYMVERRTIKSVYSLLELLWCYFVDRGLILSLKDISLQFIVDRMIAIKEANGWKNLDYNYVSQIRTPSDKTSTFVKLLMECQRIVSPSDSLESFSSTVICEYTGTDFIDEIFVKDSEFEFSLSDDRESEKKCVLTINCVKDDNPETFSIKLKLPDPNLRAHLVLEWFGSGVHDWNILPISWCGRPIKYKSANVLWTNELWIWGYLLFGASLSENELRDSWSKHLVIHDDSKCRLRLLTFLPGDSTGEAKTAQSLINDC